MVIAVPFAGAAAQLSQANTLRSAKASRVQGDSLHAFPAI